MSADGRVSVVVAGSCITRDNFNSRFNPRYAETYVCPLHQNQTSLISLMAPPIEAEWEPTGRMSDYDRWNVRTELDKSFLAEAAALQPSYLVLDFFGDVHFGVVQVDGGTYVTDNRWKIRPTTWYARMSEEGRLRRVDRYGEEHLALWRDAFDRFLVWFRENLPETTLVLHRGHFTNRLQLPERPEPVSLKKQGKVASVEVKKTNALWSRLDDIVSATPGVEVIDLLDRRYVTYPEHPWGPFYVHYEPAYYHRFLAELHKIHLRKAGGATTTMLEELEDGVTERLAPELAAARARTKRLRARVAELEAREAARPTRRMRRVARRWAGALRR
ncbi:hypothetical protein KG112_04430 [Nocardioides sp. zg-ZUI104]|uniref:DUF6270 domain-containing protein n=1 Tax=Nocardioides faecalis TaxID=2803858 RepID=UPI001BCC64F1|nr:DUF6270 domain-containing protein [Nocardioides faecalis]MBS4752053.1 hypothetical protein [Nocardioides faecalis]